MNGALEAAGIPTASTGALVSALLAVPRGPTDAVALANRLALAAGLIAVFIHGEATRLSSQELTWGALLGA